MTAPRGDWKTHPRCGACIERAREIEEAKTRGFRASDLFAVGNPAKNQMGHEMYFSTDGRTALCAARRVTPPTYYTPATR